MGRASCPGALPSLSSWAGPSHRAKVSNTLNVCTNFRKVNGLVEKRNPNWAPEWPQPWAQQFDLLAHKQQNQVKPGPQEPPLHKSLSLNWMLLKGYCQMFLVSEMSSAIRRALLLCEAGLWVLGSCLCSLSEGLSWQPPVALECDLWREKGHAIPFSPSAEIIPTFSSFPFHVQVYLSFSRIQFPLLICSAAALNNTVSFLEMLTRGYFPNYWLNEQQLEKYMIAGSFEIKSVS